MVSEINQSKVDKYYMIPLLWSYLKEGNSETNYNGDCQGLEKKGEGKQTSPSLQEAGLKVGGSEGHLLCWG